MARPFPAFLSWAACDPANWTGHVPIDPPVEVAPSIAGVPGISGSPVVGQTLTASAAPSSGTPTPIRTWQWFRSADGGPYQPIDGATGSAYLIAVEDGGQKLRVRQIETNSRGTVHADSAEVEVNDVSDWLLKDGVWDDSGRWDDSAVWIDGEPSPFAVGFDGSPILIGGNEIVFLGGD